MIIWLIALVLMGGLGYAGRTIGAVRMAITLVGLIVGKFLGFLLGPALAPRFAEIETFANPVLQYTLPPLVVWAATLVVFVIIAQVVHMKVLMHYKYHVPDEKRVAWERMDWGVGTSLGVANGAAVLIAFLAAVQGVGYWARQVEAGAEQPGPVRFFAKAHHSLQSSGLEAMAEAAAPIPDFYYDLADVFGLIYNNPSAAHRLRIYPETVILSETPGWRSVANDGTVRSVINGQGSIMEFFGSSAVSAFVQNEAELATLEGLDYEDLMTFLQEGTSPKYAGNPLLGRWFLSIKATSLRTVKLIPEGDPQAFAKAKQLRAAMIQHLKDIEFLAAADEQVALLGSIEDVSVFTDMLTLKKVPAVDPEALQRQQQQAASRTPQMNPEEMERGMAGADEAMAEEGEGGAPAPDESGSKFLATGTWSPRGTTAGGEAYLVNWENLPPSEVLIDRLKNLLIEFGEGKAQFIKPE